ncbi:MAG TPA: DUF92 domain-containing protein [Candidatus Cybelea sp.]|jgi:uncharacterized protein (TIGR00297 family)|nr:DUF92 domain-containing protein [Candidatus Cybelea sp.]
MQIALGAALAAVVALVAFRTRALSRGGAAAAFGIGTAIFATAGWPGAAALFAFFVPSALLSRIGNGAAQTRNGWQVFANGGVAAICALLAVRGGAPFAAGFAGAFAAASADTWGTEIGIRWGRAPISILTFRRVDIGRSGGITLVGSLATLGGAFCVAVVAALVHLAPLWTVALGGVAGAMADSILGASIQALRWCPNCARECETRRHECGTPAIMRRGLSWIENDAVNFAATLCGAGVAALLAIS